MRGLVLYCFVLVLLASLYSCKKEYSYEGGPLSSGYLVKDLNNNCTGTLKGNYIVGKNLTDSNFLELEIYVSKAGSYNIQSDHINGYSFAGSGSFADTGIISIKLPTNGRPLNQGTNLFSIQYDSSTCQVVVNVQDSLMNVIQTTNPDHFPLAENNRWSYDDLSYPPDSIVKTIRGFAVLNTATYYVMDDYISFFPATNQSYYRKSGFDYLEYAAVSTYTSALDYSPTLYDDLVFLKENCRTGQKWYSNTYTGTTSFGYQVLVLRYLFQCIDADANVVINGKTFLHVCEIQMIPEVADVGASLKATGEIHTAYYAKGVGLIYREFFNGIRTHPELQIRSWLVH
ncbi:MAG TPA: hypothetical protein VGQ09_00775 [Chitinophagaceae bacterium]|jgi:hypothetical protein|nr:hypothetical protein [Chitinophagaceae bacterium]